MKLTDEMRAWLRQQDGMTLFATVVNQFCTKFCVTPGQAGRILGKWTMERK